jgi:hypothetical protein
MDYFSDGFVYNSNLRRWTTDYGGFVACFHVLPVLFFFYFIEFIRGSFLNCYRSPGALVETRTKTVTICIANQSGFPADDFYSAFCASRHANSAAVTFLFINIYNFSGCFHCFPLSSSALVEPHPFSLFPINCCHRSSPRHCRADAHHDMQDGIFSRKTMVPHFWHFMRVSSEKISTSAPQFEHLNNSTRSLRISWPGHLLSISTKVLY